MGEVGEGRGDTAGVGAFPFSEPLEPIPAAIAYAAELARADHAKNFRAGADRLAGIVRRGGSRSDFAAELTLLSLIVCVKMTYNIHLSYRKRCHGNYTNQ